MLNENRNLNKFILGILATVLILAITGAIDLQTDNIVENGTIAFKNVATSDDGLVVYVCDNNHVYRSSDGGANWSVILTNVDYGPGYSTIRMERRKESLSADLETR